MDVGHSEPLRMKIEKQRRRCSHGAAKIYAESGLDFEVLLSRVFQIFSDRISWLKRPQLLARLERVDTVYLLCSNQPWGSLHGDQNSCLHEVGDKREGAYAEKSAFL